MTQLLQQATIFDPQSPHHLQKNDIVITNGIITQIAPFITPQPDYTVVTHPNLHVSEGWFDSSVSFGEPGFEDNETLTKGLQVAAQSGFTDIALQPQTYPVVDTQSMVQWVKNRVQGGTQVHPIGALTKGSMGNELAELYDMKQAGAVGFGDFEKPLSNANILKLALQYTQDFNGIVLAFCQDKNVAGVGMVNEGLHNIRLGLKGIPALAETLAVAQALQILEYTGGHLHIPTVSASQSINLIAQAKAKGLSVTCSVSVHHLLLTDSVLHTFDTNYKIMPPLRSETDRKALVEAVQKGVIDAVTTNHQPINIEQKRTEFDYASYGTIGLESAFGALSTLLPLETIVTKFTQPKDIFGIPRNSIAVGQPANLTLFNPEPEWIFGLENISSSSKNSAFINLPMKGKVYGIIKG